MSVEFDQVRYIKLGAGGMWNDVSLDNNEIHFGFGRLDHQVGLTKDFNQIKRALLSQTHHPATASSYARQVHDFYSLGRDCLWITFARGHLWWTFSDPEVTWLGGDTGGRDMPEHGQRKRKCDGWRNTDVNGQPLAVQSLSTSLTQVGSYQQAVCSVRDRDYLYRRINGKVDPLIEEAARVNETLTDVVLRAIRQLHQNDFETLVDVIFARSGWHRTSALGGTQEFLDLAIEQPATGESAAVQVKAQADQSVLNDYIRQFDEAGSFDRLFFVCHMTPTDLSISARNDIHVWVGRPLAAIVVRLGLQHWVLEKIA